MTVVGLFLAFAVKHVLADYLLQTATMVHGKEARTRWLRPLAAHAAIHAAGTLLLALAVGPAFWWLAPVDFVLHGAIDRAKALIGGHGRWQPAEARFWWLHGADQALHHLCHFAFLLVLAGAFAAG
jgi:hypothetical protein